MLNCQLCDYFKASRAVSHNKCKHVCEYTGFIFHKNIEEYDMENHPCYDYQPNVNPSKDRVLLSCENKDLKLA